MLGLWLVCIDCMFEANIVFSIVSHVTTQCNYSIHITVSSIVISLLHSQYTALMCLK